MTRTALVERLQLKESTGPWRWCGSLLVLAKPGIVAAVTLSGFTGMVLAAGGLPEAGTVLACSAALLLMAAGSALANSVLDQSMDRRMARLVRRSAALVIIGAGPALASAVLLAVAAVTLAASLLNGRVALLLLAAALSYALCYTLFLKRRTPWAAVLGGIPGALPVLVGQVAITPGPAPGCLALFLVMLVWQPAHFWLLALSRQDEYRAAGVPVLPLAKGEPFTRKCIYLAVAALLPASLLLWRAGPCSTGYAAGALLLGGGYLAACRHFMTGNSINYRAAFRGSIAYLLLLFALIIADLCLLAH